MPGVAALPVTILAGILLLHIINTFSGTTAYHADGQLMLGCAHPLISVLVTLFQQLVESLCIPVQ